MSKPCTIAAPRCSISSVTTEALAAFDAALAQARLNTPAPGTIAAVHCRRSTGTPKRSTSFEKAIAIDKNYRRRPFQPGALAAHARRVVARLCRIRMALEAQRHDRCAPRLPRPALARRISARQRTILLAAEQGLGDTIQFVRYVPLLARAGATVVLEVQPELKALLATVDGVASCHARGETLPAYDVYCPLGSLPLALKTEPATIPADIPYLRADDAHIAKWRPSVEALPGKRVAIAWAGHARHPNDRNRSIELEMLEPLLRARRHLLHQHPARTARR